MPVNFFSVSSTQFYNISYHGWAHSSPLRTDLILLYYPLALHNIYEMKWHWATVTQTVVSVYISCCYFFFYFFSSFCYPTEHYDLPKTLRARNFVVWERYMSANPALCIAFYLYPPQAALYHLSKMTVYTSGQVV